MTEHVVSTLPARKMDAHTPFFRWACSCGDRGTSTFGYVGQAERAGRDHAAAKAELERLRQVEKSSGSGTGHPSPQVRIEIGL
ncbi:hypothetical protein ACIBH1_45245 [Nonomuraea sp. NPDC050663]|uniref:hypothetical protein n=1 Tax=Nonomuraea sp. NPDC050663 TaxID=3364370 RepID=UPI0037B73EA2